jgi:thymidylate kinase
MTKYIQLLGSPSTGKSTIAHALYSFLSLKGHHIEYIPEYTKELVYSNSLVSTPQLTITNTQYNNLIALNNQVDIVITDTHILNGIIYSHFYNLPNLKEIESTCINHLSNLNTITVYVTNNPSSIYQTEGRVQSKEDIPTINSIINTYILPLLPGYVPFNNTPTSDFLFFIESIQTLGESILTNL